MPASINFVATSNAYSDACTLGPFQTANQVSFTVGNDAVYCELAKLDKTGQPYWDKNEFGMSPTSGGFQECYGIRFRSYQVGKAAVIAASLFFTDDPQPTGSTPFLGTLTAQGGITSGIVITGSITPAGAIAAGSGFTCVRSGTGQYDITFTTAFTAPPLVLANMTNAYFRFSPYFPGANLLSTGFRINWVDQALAAQDTSFSFAAQAYV